MAQGFQSTRVLERLRGVGFVALVSGLTGLGVGALSFFNTIGPMLIPIVLGLLVFGLVFLLLRMALRPKQSSESAQLAKDLVAFERSVDERMDGYRQALLDQQRLVAEQVATVTQRLDASHTVQNSATEALTSQVDALKDQVARLEKQANPRSVAIPGEDAAAAQVPPIAVVPKAEAPINVKSVVANDGLSMHLQPIVDIAARKPVLYEAFMRVRSARGQFLEQAQFQKMANQGGLMPTINKKVLFSSLRMLRRLGEKQMRAGVLCQIAGQSLSDTKGFQEIAALLKAYAHMNDLIVIEVSQRTFNGLKDRERERLSLIADIGFPLSLGQADDVGFDPQVLFAKGFRYVRCPTSILLHADIDEGGGHTSREDFAAGLENAGLTLVAEGVEREQDALRLIDLNVMYGQGSLFAPPRPVKPELLQAPSFEAASPRVSAGG